MKCPHCGKDINIGSLLGSATSKAKARAARRNAKLGGWPKGKKRGKRKPKKENDPNVIAFNVLKRAEQTANRVIKHADSLKLQLRPPQPPEGQ